MTNRLRSLPLAIVVGLALVLTFLLPCGSAAAACAGDCNGDEVVTVNEIITGVNIALGSQPLTACTAFDADNDGAVTITDLIAAINSAVNGCGEPTPTPTPGAGESVCGGPITSVPQLCNFSIMPNPLPLNASYTLQIGIADLEGDIDMLCLGLGPAGTNPPPSNCAPLPPAGSTINAVGSINSQSPLPASVGDYELSMQVKDSAGHASNIVTTTLTIIAAPKR